MMTMYSLDGGQRAAQEMGVPFLGELPMFPELRVNSDAGTPVANFEGTPQLRESLETIARNLLAQVTLQQMAQPTVTLNVK